MAKRSFFSAKRCWYGSYDTTIMVPTTRVLWYLPHDHYGRYHNVVFKFWDFSFGSNELFSLYLQIYKKNEYKQKRTGFWPVLLYRLKFFTFAFSSCKLDIQYKPG
jgi:hypothetical protein